MKTPLEMAACRLRFAVREALSSGLGSAQIETTVAEECTNEVDYDGHVVDYIREEMSNE